MDRQFVNSVLVQVRKRMKTFEVPGCRQSRRIEGMFNRDDEIHGFKNLCIYIDSALAGKMDTICEILGYVDGFIYGQEHFNYTRCPMIFGGVPEKLVVLKRSDVHQGIRANSWEGLLSKHLAAEVPGKTLIIPRIRTSESAGIRSPDRYDLGLFFCRSMDVSVRSEEEQIFFGQIGSRCIWIFFGEEETPHMETGIFVPQLMPDCN